MPNTQPPPGFDVKGMLQKLIEGQAKTQLEVSKKITELQGNMDGGYNDLHTKFDNLATHVKSLDNRPA